jgi:hypothetical protein
VRIRSAKDQQDRSSDGELSMRRCLLTLPIVLAIALVVFHFSADAFRLILRLLPMVRGVIINGIVPSTTAASPGGWRQT